MAENKHGIEELGDVTRLMIIPSKNPDTLQIACPEVESGYMVINAADFDAATMAVYTEKSAKKARE
jgi:hypothetical protein